MGLTCGGLRQAGCGVVCRGEAVGQGPLPTAAHASKVSPPRPAIPALASLRSAAKRLVPTRPPRGAESLPWWVVCRSESRGPSFGGPIASTGPSLTSKANKGKAMSAKDFFTKKTNGNTTTKPPEKKEEEGT